MSEKDPSQQPPGPCQPSLTQAEFARALVNMDRSEVLDRWGPLAEGALSSAEAAPCGAGASEEDRLAHEIFRPLGKDAHARMAALALRSRRTRRVWVRRSVIGSVPALAAAAALVLLLRTSAPLPEFDVSVISPPAAQQMGPNPGESGTQLRLAPESPLTIILRPRHKVSVPVDVRAFLVPQGGTAQPWQVKFDSTDGAFMLQGKVRDVLPGIPAGRWVLLLAVGPPGDLPADPAAVQRAAAEGGRGPGGRWHVYEKPLEVSR